MSAEKGNEEKKFDLLINIKQDQPKLNKRKKIFHVSWIGESGG